MSTQSRRPGLVSLATLACLLATMNAAGQQHPFGQVGTPEKPPNPTVAAPRASADYVIGPEDVLAIDVWKEPEVSRTVPVRPDGKISLPLIGDLEASGHTTTELRNVIAERLKAFMTNPEVAVIIQEIKSQKFNVVGGVLRPGTYPLAEKVTVLDAIAMAGGFQEFAKTKKIYVLRRQGGSQVRLPFNYKAVIKGKNSDQNVELKPGDTIVVP